MSDTESGLMKQTKKELIAIILRKDDTEKKLNKELDDVKLDFDKVKKMIAEKDIKIADNEVVISNLNRKLNDFKFDLQKVRSMIDKNESIIKTLRENLDKSEKNVNQHQNAIDELTVINADVEHSLRNAKRWNVALAILFVCAVAAVIIF